MPARAAVACKLYQLKTWSLPPVWVGEEERDGAGSRYCDSVPFPPLPLPPPPPSPISLYPLPASLPLLQATFKEFAAFRESTQAEIARLEGGHAQAREALAQAQQERDSLQRDLDEHARRLQEAEGQVARTQTQVCARLKGLLTPVCAESQAGKLAGHGRHTPHTQAGERAGGAR